MPKINLHDVIVNYSHRSAHQVIYDMCMKLGIENIRAELDDIESAQQSAQADGAKCLYCGSPMPKNEIHCKVCHPFPPHR